MRRDRNGKNTSQEHNPYCSVNNAGVYVNVYCSNVSYESSGCNLGLRDYAKLGNRYTEGFDRKWVHFAKPPDEPLLGTADIQSLADLGGSFERIQEMSIAPITKGLVIQFVVMAGLPILPVVIYATPTGELVKAILKMVA